MAETRREGRERTRPTPHAPPAEVAEQNIRTVAELERRAEDRRSTSERTSSLLVRVMGSMGFVLFHVALFAAWFAINLGLVPWIEPFDPFPFGVLTLLVSAEGVFLAIFVLISQNRLSRESNQRAHLDLQISMLAEAEATKILAILRGISRRLGHDPRLDEAELEELTTPTDLPAIADTIEREIKAD
jgi:uncharacterized membrane protein